MGDFNFNVDVASMTEQEQILSYKELKQSDECFDIIFNWDLLTNYKEKEISFKPTYKFKVGQDSYNFKFRNPAWTDRVLYWK